MAEYFLSYITFDGLWLAPFSRKYIPTLSPPLAINEVSTPRSLKEFTPACPI